MTTQELRLLRVNYLRGPNLWTYRPVIEAWVDLGRFEALPTNRLPGFTERLLAALPGLHEHRCGVGERGGFVLRLNEGTWLGHVMEHVAIELQNRAGMQSGFGKARETSTPGVYKVVFRSREERVGRAAIELARELVLACVEGSPFDLTGRLAALTDLVDRHGLGPSTASIVLAAVERGVPSLRLNDGNLVQLGYGRRQRRVWTAETEHTGAIAESIASDKDLTKTLLASCGVPVPEGRLVDSPADAWEAAEDIGVPVVVKPDNGNHGRGVSLELTTQAEVEAAFPVADAEGSGVMVERFIRGDEHRVLVVGNKMAAAIRGESIFIIGDGVSDVRALIERQLNTDPRRGEAEEFPLETIVLDREPGILLQLERQGMAPDSVPAEGQKVLIQRTGTYATDVTAQVHPDTARIACLAARIVGLDIAGIDLVVEDIGRPLAEQGGAIVEVNAGPGLLMHLKPAHGEPQPVGDAIVEHLMGDADGRIPVIGITGLDGVGTVATLVARLAAFAGHAVGLASDEGVFFGRRRIDQRTTLEAAQQLLINRNVGLAVFATLPLAILEEGLPYDRCSVGVVLSLTGAPPLPAHDILTAEQWRSVLRTQVDVVLEQGVAVLNADDPAVADLAELCDGEVMLVTADPTCPPLAAHLQSGGRAVILRDGHGECRSGDQRIAEVPLPDCDAAQTSLLLAALAAAWAAGVPTDALAAGLTDALDHA